MFENFKKYMEIISTAIVIGAALINGFKSIKTITYKQKFESRYGIDSDNLDTYIWRNRYQFFQSIVQIILIIFMAFVIRSVNNGEATNSALSIILHFVFIFLFIVQSIIISRKEKEFSPLIIGFVLLLIFGIVFFTKRNKEWTLEYNLYIWIAYLYFNVVMMYLIQALNFSFTDEYNRKAYELITFISKENCKDDYVKIISTDEGILIMGCKEGKKQSFDKKTLDEIGIKSKDDNSELLFIKKEEYRFVDPKDVKIHRKVFNEVEVIKTDLFNDL